MSAVPTSITVDRLIGVALLVARRVALRVITAARSQFATVREWIVSRSIRIRLTVVRFVEQPLTLVETKVATARRWQQVQARAAVAASSRQAARAIDHDWAQARRDMTRCAGQSRTELTNGRCG